MSDAVTITEGGRPAIRLERILPDPPHVVWAALTERDRLRTWFPSDVVVDGGRWLVGARIRFPFPPEVIDLTLTGTVLAVEEPDLLSFTWGEEILRFELAPHEGGTRLVLVDQLPAPWAARNAAGWETCLDRLVGVEPGTDDWRGRFERYAAAFGPSLGPQDGPPEGHVST